MTSQTKKVVVIGMGPMGVAQFAVLQQAQQLGLDIAIGICSRDRLVRDGDLRGVRNNNLDIEVPKSFDVRQVSVYANLEAVCSDDSVTGVIICAPTALHVELSCRALNAGKHVLVEKPVGATPQELGKLRTIIQENPHLVIGVGQVLPYFRPFDQLHQLLTAERMTANGGSLKMTRTVYSADPLANPEKRWKVVNPFFDLAVHDLHFVRRSLGPISWPKNLVECAKEWWFAEQTDYLLGAEIELSVGAVTVTIRAGVDNSQERPFRHSYSGKTPAGVPFSYKMGDEGLHVPMEFSYKYEEPTWMQSDLPAASEPIAAEQFEWLRGIDSGKLPEGSALNPEFAIDATLLGLQIGESIRGHHASNGTPLE